MTLTTKLTKASGRITAGTGAALSGRVMAAAATTVTVAAMIASGGAAFAATAPAAHKAQAVSVVQLSCAANPHLCGYPDATNTGVQPGQTLIAVPGQQTSGPGWYFNRTWGSVEVTGAGAVLNDLAITGNVDVRAANVTLDNVKVIDSGNDWGIGLEHASSTLIEHSEVYSPAGADRLQVAIKDVYGDATGTRIQTTSIWDTGTAIQVSEGYVAGNYVHSLKGDPGDHVNGIVSDAGEDASLTVTGNTVFNPSGQTDCIAMLAALGQQKNVTITGNLMSGGGYEVYGGDGRWTPFNIVITGNRFARTYYPNGGSYGPDAHVSTSGVNGNIWSGNIWDNTGSPVNA